MSTEPNDKHLALVQGVVNRLAGNSFALKGWSVTLVSALLALAAKDADTWLVAIALLPTLTFGGWMATFSPRSGCSAASTPGSSTPTTRCAASP